MRGRSQNANVVHNKIVVFNHRIVFPKMKMKTGIRLVRSGNKIVEPKIQFLLNYRYGQVK